ncbi:MAG: 7-carboxy-7-deazaguanine synthase QueE [bacterium]|nr:7-carboxy-7-deazaguanine synthase QueE [bacterium]
MQKYKIVEIFDSIQGEGPYLGERQIFIRLGECNLSCVYCDTDFKRYVLMTAKEIFDQVNEKTIVFTGGEPLLQSGLIKEIRKLEHFVLKKNRIMLETNATLSSQLAEVIDYVDVFSCDYKLRKYANIDQKEHQQFFAKLEAKNKNFYVKIITDDDISLEEFKEEIKYLQVNKNTKIILQPIFKESLQYSAQFIKYHQILLNKGFEKVFFIPQVHKFLGVN